MKYVVLYESADEVAIKAAEEFIVGDPFVLNGVIRGHEIGGWNEILTEP